MTTLLLIFLFGLFLGFKHAFDIDHLVAVATLVTEHKNTFRAALIGVFWGFGHTTTLFIVGLIILLLKINIPERVSLSLDFLVALMLIGLGIRTLRSQTRSLHTHSHHHDHEHHTHPHVTHQHAHHRSFAIGAVHGLAGSGAIMILVLSSFRSLIGGLMYILLFGIGSVVGMSLMSIVMGLPFIYSTKKFASFNQVEKNLRHIAGTVSIGFGLRLAYEIGFKENLFFR